VKEKKNPLLLLIRGRNSERWEEKERSRPRLLISKRTGKRGISKRGGKKGECLPFTIPDENGKDKDRGGDEGGKENGIICLISSSIEQTCEGREKSQGGLSNFHLIQRRGGEGGGEKGRDGDRKR